MTKNVRHRNKLVYDSCDYLWRPLRALIVAVAVFWSSAAAQQITDVIDFEIPEQTVASALLSFSEQADLQIIVDASVVDGLRSGAVSGSMQANDALDALLEQTDLGYEYSSARTVTVLPNGGDKGVDAAAEESGSSATDEPNTENVDTSEDPSISATTSTTSGPVLEEIIVTAQKREESLQRTPLSLAAFTADQLEKSLIQDLYDVGIQTPGMIVNKEVVGKIYIRGIGAENLTIGGDPGVAVHTDGAYIARTSAAIFDLYDVERVEVLRGPQGTL